MLPFLSTVYDATLWFCEKLEPSDPRYLEMTGRLYIPASSGSLLFTTMVSLSSGLTVMACSTLVA